MHKRVLLLAVLSGFVFSLHPDCIEAFKKLRSAQNFAEGIHYFLLKQDPNFDFKETKMLSDFAVKRLRKNENLGEVEAQKLIALIFIEFNKKFLDTENCGEKCQFILKILQNVKDKKSVEKIIKDIQEGDIAALTPVEEVVEEVALPVDPKPKTKKSKQPKPLSEIEFKQLRAEFEKVGIKTISHIQNLAFNGSQSYRPFQRTDHVNIFANRAEYYAAKIISHEGEIFISVGDVGVQQMLFSRRSVVAPDLISFIEVDSEPIFRIREVKTGKLFSNRIPKAFEQLTAGISGLLEKIPDAKIDCVEIVNLQKSNIVLPEPFSLGASLTKGRYPLLSKGVPCKINVKGTEYPVTIREIDTPLDDADLSKFEESAKP